MNIDELWVFRYVPVIVPFGIKVLDQMVPEVPLPYDSSPIWSSGLDFDNAVRPEPRRAQPLGITSRSNGLFWRLGLPGNSQDVTIGQGLDVVMLEPSVVGEDEVPDDLAIPVQLLNPSSASAATKRDIRMPSAS